MVNILHEICLPNELAFFLKKYTFFVLSWGENVVGFFVVFFLSAINIKIPINKLVDIYRMSVKDFCIDAEK